VGSLLWPWNNYHRTTQERRGDEGGGGGGGGGGGEMGGGEAKQRGTRNRKQNQLMNNRAWKIIADADCSSYENKAIHDSRLELQGEVRGG